MAEFFVLLAIFLLFNLLGFRRKTKKEQPVVQGAAVKLHKKPEPKELRKAAPVIKKASKEMTASPQKCFCEKKGHASDGLRDAVIWSEILHNPYL